MRKEQRKVMQEKKLSFYDANRRRIQRLSRLDKDWRDPVSRAIVEEARSAIGYSEETAVCDIFNALVSLTPAWKERSKNRWKGLKCKSW